MSPVQAKVRPMNRFSAAAGLVSPRTGKRLFLNPRRFRYSIAKHMAEEGASIFHIAELLDHSDTLPLPSELRARLCGLLADKGQPARAALPLRSLLDVQQMMHGASRRDIPGDPFH